MPKLQACAKCAAQFDVSAMATGAAFTCGACGAVVTVGGSAPAAPPSRVPPAPSSRPIPAPASRPIPAPAKGGSNRGPQYIPVERRREAAAATAAAPAPRRGREEPDARPARGRGDRHAERPAKKGPSTPMLVGAAAGGLALILVVGMLLIKKSPTPDLPPKAGGPTATSPTGTTPAGTPPGTGTATVKPGPAGTPSGGDTFASVDAEYGAKKHWPNDDLKRFFERFKLLGSAGATRTKDLADLILREADPNFAAARTLRGYKEFSHPVPDMISFTNYPYIRAVEEANKQRWFGADEAKEYELAMHAWAKTQAHEKKLDPDTGDSTFRALDGARRGIAHDQHFKDYNYEAIFASPYLICYSSDERLSEEDLLAIPKKDRQAKLAELEATRKTYQRVLAEKAKIYQQLYAEFLKRYAEDCELKDLMGAYGGRPDYPMSKRSYKDGCPMIIWIFSDRKAFDDYHNNVVKSNIPSTVAGYFSPTTGWVYLYDEPDNREFEINKNVHEGTHQLEHWFQKQKREWGPTRVPQSFFGEGFAEYIGAVNLAKDRTLKFHGINRPRLEFLKSMEAQMKQQGRKLPIFPTKVLVGFEGYSAVDAWARDNWKMQGLGIFYAQSWAFVYFLNEGLNKKYQAKFNGYLDDMLAHPSVDAEGYAFERFKQRFGIKSEGDWNKLQAEFEKYYVETLIPMDLSKVGDQPPSREDWPGYTPIEPVDPTK